MELRIAGAQIPVVSDIEANVETLTRAIEFAGQSQAHILLTPEGSLSGYTHIFDQETVQKALAHITRLACKQNIGLALGTCFIEPRDGRCYNQIRFYQPDGVYLGFHSKTLTCGSWDDPPEGEINHYAVSPLQTYIYHDVPVGGLICNDMWANPQCTPVPDAHLSQKLSKMGAQIVFHAVNGGRDGSDWSDVAWNYHESNLRMRARAGRIWIVTVDNCHPDHIRCSSPSGVIDPEGTWACRTESRGEQFFIHSITLA